MRVPDPGAVPSRVREGCHTQVRVHVPDRSECAGQERRAQPAGATHHHLPIPAVCPNPSQSRLHMHCKYRVGPSAPRAAPAQPHRSGGRTASAGDARASRFQRRRQPLGQDRRSKGPAAPSRARSSTTPSINTKQPVARPGPRVQGPGSRSPPLKGSPTQGEAQRPPGASCGDSRVKRSSVVRDRLNCSDPKMSH